MRLGFNNNGLCLFSGVLVLLAALSALGGFIPVVHFLEPMLPLPKIDDALHHYEGTLIGIAVAIGFAGLAIAWFFFSGDASRAARLRERVTGLHRVLSEKYYVDELYDALLGRPITWVSKRVFLQFGDRFLIDGTLHLLAASARRGAAAFGALQAGNLQRYAFYAVLGVLAAVAWGLRHA